MDLVALKVKSWDEMPVSHEFSLCSLGHHSLPSSGSSCFRPPYTDITFPFLVDKESLQPQAWI